MFVNLEFVKSGLHHRNTTVAKFATVQLDID